MLNLYFNAWQHPFQSKFKMSKPKISATEMVKSIYGKNLKKLKTQKIERKD